MTHSLPKDPIVEPLRRGSPLGRRHEPRLCTLFRTGKLVLPYGETLCRVRNISPNGFMADVCPAPAAGEIVALELCEGRRHPARVAWAEAGRMGAEFLIPRGLGELLAEAGRSPKRRDRAVRIVPEEAFATVRAGPWTGRVSILNISQTGAALFACDLLIPAVPPPPPLALEVDGLDPQAATLRWSGSGAAGVQFERPLSFETLSHWLWANALAGPPRGPQAAGAQAAARARW